MTTATTKPKPDIGPNCNCCQEWRKKLGRKNQVVVYAERGEVKFCECQVCKNTFKTVAK